MTIIKHEIISPMMEARLMVTRALADLSGTSNWDGIAALGEFFQMAARGRHLVQNLRVVDNSDHDILAYRLILDHRKALETFLREVRDAE
jgi:hypothetical protein